MRVSELAGKVAPIGMLVNVGRLVSAYYTGKPEGGVAFGTSGHRGTSFGTTFNEGHILAITEAICRYRKVQGTDGPLFLGKDTHALSEPAFFSALEVLAAHEIDVMIDQDSGFTPTPVVSHAILNYPGVADGIVITPSHNPPEDGGFKYNPPNGGPADTVATKWIENEANRILAGGLQEVRRMTLESAMRAPTTHRHDYISGYVNELDQVIDMEAIRGARLKLGVDPMGGAGVNYWARIAEHHGFELEVVNPNTDQTFRFMTVDWDGKIRMDCSSPYAMASLIALRDRFDVAWASDTDHDRHGIVTRTTGLMNPNHYLAAAIDYLFQNRPGWRIDAGVGKTLVSSSMIDRVARSLKRKLVEVPVGFKWFVGGLMDGSLGFGGEESAGASFLRLDGKVWSTDKDGLILGLLAAEMMAVTGVDPAERYRSLTEQFGAPVYERIDAPANAAQKAVLAKLSADQLTATQLAGEPITATLTTAPGNGAPLGGLKVETANGWFAARPSGTEDVYKIYAESFVDQAHLLRIQAEAQDLISAVFTANIKIP